MLILSRKSGETIVIDGRIRVTVMRVDGEAVKIGIDAPAHVPVHRQEIYDEIQRSNKQAVTRQSVALPKFLATHHGTRVVHPGTPTMSKAQTSTP